MLYSASWAILSILLAKCLAGSGGTAFLGPSGITGANVQQEQTWLIGDDKHFTWNGTWAAADLTYQATDSEVAITIGSYITNFSLEWNVNVSESQSPTNSQYFFFYLLEWSDPTNYVVSNLIRVIQDPADPTFSSTTSAQVTIETQVVTRTSSLTSFLTVTDTAAKATSTLAIATTTSTNSTVSTSSSSNLIPEASTPAIPQTTGTTSAIPIHSSLNTGDKVALGVAIPLGVLALLSLCACAWWCRKRRRTRQQKRDKDLARSFSTLQDMYRSELGADAGISEKDVDDYDDNGVKRARRGVSEMSGLSRPSELDATERDAMMIHELPNSEVGDPERRSLMRRSLMSGTTMWSPPISPMTDVSRDSRE